MMATLPPCNPVLGATPPGPRIPRLHRNVRCTIHRPRRKSLLKYSGQPPRPRQNVPIILAGRQLSPRGRVPVRVYSMGGASRSRLALTCGHRKIGRSSSAGVLRYPQQSDGCGMGVGEAFHRVGQVYDAGMGDAAAPHSRCVSLRADDGQPVAAIAADFRHARRCTAGSCAGTATARSPACMLRCTSRRANWPARKRARPPHRRQTERQGCRKRMARPVGKRFFGGMNCLHKRIRPSGKPLAKMESRAS